MQNIKSIEFVFENCEGFEIDAKYFGIVAMDSIRTVVARVACNSISKYTTVGSVIFEIFSEANVEYDGFGEPTLKFDRICMHRDITAIALHYEDGESETYYVNYEDEVEGQLGTPNKNQKVHINSFGNLYLIIDASKEIFDFFDKDDMEDKEKNEFSKSMILY